MKDFLKITNTKIKIVFSLIAGGFVFSRLIIFVFMIIASSVLSVNIHTGLAHMGESV